MNRTRLTMLLVILGAVTILGAEDGDQAYSEEGVKKLEEKVRLIAFSADLWPDDKGHLQRVRDLVETNSIPLEVYINTVEKVSDDLIASLRFHANGRTVIGINAMAKALNFMGDMGDQAFLPWLELQATGSQWSDVRTRAAVNYVKIAGLDAVPFVRRILSGSEEKYDFNCKNLVSREFFEQITKAEAAKAPQEKIAAAYAMLIEQAKTVAYVGHADRIDKFLCTNLEGYRTSIQREKSVERFVNSENEIARTNFGKKRDEIQKTPQAERIDLRIRFPGLAVPEVLKDSSKEASDSDEETSEDK